MRLITSAKTGWRSAIDQLMGDSLVRYCSTGKGYAFRVPGTTAMGQTVSFG